MAAPTDNEPQGSKISNSGVTEAEKDYDEYFDHNEIEEYINIRDSDQSCHILPLSNTKYNSGDSQFEDDEVDSVIEDEEDAEDPLAEGGISNRHKKPQVKHEFRDSDPEVQNARLLQKYAEMQGADTGLDMMVTSDHHDH